MSEDRKIRKLLDEMLKEAHPPLSEEEAKERYLYPRGRPNYLITEQIRQQQTPVSDQERDLIKLADHLEKFYKEVEKQKYEEFIKKGKPEPKSGWHFPTDKDFMNAFNIYLNRNNQRNLNTAIRQGTRGYLNEEQRLQREYERELAKYEKMIESEKNRKLRSVKSKIVKRRRQSNSPVRRRK